MRTWVLHKLENRDASLRTNPNVHREILRKLYEAETFENFLHTKYGGKRFSLEGGEALILALDTIVQNCEKRGIKELIMGMAHRGRLNVLANTLNKPLDVIFNEFQGNFAPDSVCGNGDVKYHLGYRNVRTTSTGYEVDISLAANPSHLAAVDPVVEGRPRAPACAGRYGLPEKVIPSLSTATRRLLVKAWSRRSSTCLNSPATAPEERSTSSSTTRSVSPRCPPIRDRASIARRSRRWSKRQFST
jgi:2-oxoglutarate dehydrogenase E1 component